MHVSIVVPVLNEASTIQDLLRSIAQLDYSREETEVWIVDSGSRDGTQEIVKQFPYQLLECEKRNENAARNLGIRRSHGDIIAFTDGDCVVSPSWLKDLVGGFDNPTIGGVAGPVVLLPPNSFAQRLHQYLAPPGHNTDLLPYPLAVTANVAYRRTTFEKAGLFDERFKASMDVDLALRMQKERGLSLRLLAGAGIVYHHPEKSLFDLISRAWRYGFGYYLLSRKHPYEFPLTTLRSGLYRRWDRMRKNGRSTEERMDFSFAISLKIFRTVWQLTQDSGTVSARILLGRLPSNQFNSAWVPALEPRNSKYTFPGGISPAGNS